MDEEEVEQPERKRRKTSRDAELSGRKTVCEEAIKVCQAAQKAFDDQRDRSEASSDHWSAFNVQLTDLQYYHGTSEICAPFVQDAVRARQTRFSGQLFPENQKHVEAVGQGPTPFATISLIEHYIRQSKLKTNVVDPLLINGDVEGQYNVFVSWEKRTRHVTAKVKKPVEDDDGMETGDEVEDMADEEEVVDSGPAFEVLADSDVAVFPSTCQTVEQALEDGGGVVILRRWTKGQIKRKQASGEIDSAAAERILDQMTSVEKAAEIKDVNKDKARAAGLKLSGKTSLAIVFDIWCKLKVDGQRRICRILWAGDQVFLSIKRNPYWCDRVPLFSCPVDRVSGLFKGKAPVASVLGFHILGNDIINEMADSGHFSMLPIIMTDPARNPRVTSMVLAPAAIWETDPQSTEFAEFPDMWKTGIERAVAIRSQIFQTLGVNPSMIPGTTGSPRKMNQAEIALEQQVDILTTADAVTVLEEGILTPMISFILELDHQFRDESVLVRSFGPVGEKIMMEEIEPQQIDRKVVFRWLGVEAAKNAAKMQQQIAFINVLRGIPPQAYPGYQLNLAPVIEQQTENLFGPVLAPQIFKREDEITIDPHIENEMMEHGFDVEVHPGDQDIQHLQVHMIALKQSGDPHATIRKHIQKHQAQALAKAQKQMMARQAQPQGGGAPGPTMGGQPGMPQSQPGAPGQIHPDQMARAGAPGMPRKE
jgi:hypothetical protein